MCYDTHSDYDQFEFIVISVHLSARAFTRAGFESTTVFAPLKELSSLNKSGLPLISVDAAQTNHKKTRAFERRCTVSQ
jgi:hypothetical protein